MWTVFNTVSYYPHARGGPFLYTARTSSLAGMERALVLESWQIAANVAKSNGIHVEFLACPLEDDVAATPHFSHASTPVIHYATDPHGRKFPTIGGIFDKGVKEGVGKYLVYTNMDIGVHKDFYTHSYNLLINAENSRKEKLETDPKAPWTALEYTRVQSIRLKPLMQAPTLTEVLEYPEVGRHPGHDCFILPRLMVPLNMRSGGLVVGMPPWGTMYHLGIQNDPQVDLLFLQGTSSQRYTFHTGVDGTVESWMDNQDFRLQQYAEAFRLFGAESIGRAWGAKGRNSPFFYMCNGTVMRFPMCSFCETFYPSTLYSEFSKRVCKGTITDRSFFSHLPIPEHTTHTELGCEGGSKSRCHPRTDDVKQSTFSSGDGQLAKMLGRKAPCKVKCIQEKALCKKVSIRSWIPSGSRHVNSSEEAGGLHSAPPMLWSHFGGRSEWLRLMLENALGYKTGSIVMSNQISIQDTPVGLIDTFLPVKGEKKKSDVINLDLRHGCEMSALAILVEPIQISSGIDEKDGEFIQEYSKQISPSCLSWPKFAQVIAVVRNPYDSIWQQYHTQWLVKKDPSFATEVQFSDSLGHKLALNFIGDSDSIDEFKMFAIKHANSWNGVHTDLIKYKQRHDSVFLLRFEDLDQNIDDTGSEALIKLSHFLGLNEPSANRLHCSYVSSKGALMKELNPLQKASSMDSLYEGLITCRMWTIFSRTAIQLGYLRPFNHMACFQMNEGSTVQSRSAITEASVTMLNNEQEEILGEVDFIVECGYFRWLLDASETLQTWLKNCGRVQ